MDSQQQTAGPGAVAIQAAGDNISIIVGTARLTLARRHRLKGAKPETERDLLLTELRTIDLVGRGNELAELRAWLDNERRISVRCVTGRAGAGKTRLAIELCEQAEAADWIAGFVTHRELQRFHDAASLDSWHWRRPTLIVVDYAAAAQRVLRAWFEALARRRSEPSDGALRFLLLERSASQQFGWWAELMDPGGASGRGPDELADPLEPVALPVLAAPEERRALLTQACTQAASLADRPVPALPPPGADPDFDRRLGVPAPEAEPLFLLMAGIVGVQTGVPQALALRADQLADRIARSERSRLQRLAASWGVDGTLGPAKFVHLAACVTLLGGCDRGTAAALVRDEWAAMGWAGELPADWIALRLGEALARRGGGVEPVRPDLIGEAFLLQVMCEDSRPATDQAAIVERIWRYNPTAVTTTLARIAQDFANESLDHVSLGWLDHVCRAVSETAGLMVLAFNLPWESLVLRECAAAVTERLAAALGVTPPEGIEHESLYAATLNSLAVRLSALGKRGAALQASKKAAELYRTLIDRGIDAARPGLAQVACNRAYLLNVVGDHAAASSAAREAVALYRDLATLYPDAFRFYLAASLNNLGSALCHLGELREALAAVQEAVGLNRKLMTERPDAFRPNLAASLNNLADTLRDYGEHEGALNAAREAVELHRTLALRQPDAFRPKLAQSLRTLAASLGEVGQRQLAVAAAREAVDLYRPMAALHPAAFRRELATSLNELAIRLSQTGDRNASLDIALEVVEVYRELASAEPEVFRSDLAMALHNLGNRLSLVGERGAALASAREAESLYRALGAEGPSEFRRELAMALDSMANKLYAVGEYQTALHAARQSVERYRNLMERDPKAFAFQFGFSLNTLATVLWALGENEPALAAAHEAIEIFRGLAESLPDAFRPNLAKSLSTLAANLVSLRRSEDALVPVRESVALYRMLAADYPDAFVADLGRSLTGLAITLSELDDSKLGLLAAQEAVEIYRRQVDRYPDAFRPELAQILMVRAHCFDQVGQAQSALSDNMEAITLLNTALPKTPEAVRVIAGRVIREYLSRCEKMATSADHDLIGPVGEFADNVGAKVRRGE